VSPQRDSDLELAGALTETPALEQLLDRAALDDVCRATHDTFDVAIRVTTSRGKLLYEDVRGDGVVWRECELPIRYDGRSLGMLTMAAAERRSEELHKLTRHFVRTLEVLLFSGHRAHLASTLHLASAESNYRALAAQNEQLQQAYDKLKELDRLKSTFLATMSHELRTPLTSIIGYSEMLASGMGGELNATQQEFIDTIRAKGDHLLELILTLLDVAKLEQDQLRILPIPIDPGELARDALRTISPVAQKKGITLDAQVSDALPQVSADQARLRQVLLNLLDNAVKFTPSGGTVSLEVAPAALSGDEHGDGLVLLSALGRAVEFTIRDTGIGIPEAELTRIFDAFYQVDGSATREHGGTGLGLSIVKRLVEAHDGTIIVTSRQGQGSEFRVRIAAAEP
jgi:two-component system sensor histidine kinase BarA